MTGWSFPATVPAYSSQSVYVEFQTGCLFCIGFKSGDDAAEATYSVVDGHGSSFQIQARASSGFTLQVVLSSMATQNNNQGSTIALGWKWNGAVNWVLSGAGPYMSTNPPAAWMQANLALLGGTPLGKLTLPGSHDAGMNALTGHTAGAVACNTLTQTVGIAGQLAAGSRYFDIRPVIAGGAYATGHYSFISALDSWQGGNGESMANIISDINAFTAAHAELIVLDLSHDLDTDIGNSNYSAFTQAQYNALFSQMQGINALFVASRFPAGMNAATVDLTTLPLSAFIGTGQAAVVVVVEPTAIALGAFAGQGFFTAAQLSVENQFSDTEDLGTMSSDQFAKMSQYADQDFLLSWTLTQGTANALDCSVGGTSILSLAATADAALYAQVMDHVSPAAYPKILFVDKMDDSNIVPLALGISTRVLWYVVAQLGVTSQI